MAKRKNRGIAVLTMLMLGLSIIVLGLLAMVGVIALCLGFFVTMPLTLLAMMHLYEHIFGNRRAADILQS